MPDLKLYYRAGAIAIPDAKFYFRAIVIKTARY